MSGMLIVSVALVMVYIVLMYYDMRNEAPAQHIYIRNYFLLLGIACFDIVLLILAVKYFVIGIKMELTLQGADPERYDSSLNKMYVSLILLNLLFPMLEATFVTFGDLDDTDTQDWIILRRISQTLTFTLEVISFILFCIGLYKIHSVLKGQKTVELLPKSVYMVATAFLLFLIGVGVNGLYLNENVGH